VDVPYNGDADRVVPVAGAREALDRLRTAGVRLGVVTNQAAVGRGWITAAAVQAVNRRVETFLGPLDPWLMCLHRPEDGCACRKPAPGLILEAAKRLGISPSRCVVIGDTAADVMAAHMAGARGILVPNEPTRPEEVAHAPEVAVDLHAAVDRILGVDVRHGRTTVETAA
jgi:histidinol-phosphate phosphatase family protein